MGSRNNSFDLIRHFAALLVLFSHHFALSNLAEPTFLHWDTFGFVAVVIFFAISGYFMPASFTNSGNFAVFMAKRCRRIFPGLMVCSLIMVYLIGSIFTSSPTSNYLFSLSTLKTSIMYSSFMAKPIPGVFSDFLCKDVINGSLWTLPVEFASYIIIGVVLSYINSWKSILPLLLSCIVITMILTKTGKNYGFYSIPLNYLALFGIAFSGGALMSMTKDYWYANRIYLAIAAIVLLTVLQRRPEMQVLGTLSLAALTIIVGISFQEKWINGKFDISYGIYIYAFPIQQLVINLITSSFWLSMVIATLFTLLVAYLSYRFVEKPFLYANTHRQPADQLKVIEFSASASVH
ncbi:MULTISPECIES: acyltransferase family protein [Legionella]|uniref:Acyltransferase n=1 Tax=Legionella drozanskii LLAP-1 TaxID=1212489 RepID=A0A0W0SQA9_9GAMM|nr:MULTISPECIES: acyltransferase [Legionella]KTC85385.1 acyltransferase [Legionella drozanskii LLAP-1]